MLESLNAYKFILAAVNLIILYLILRKILFKPVTEFMENRTKAIQDSIEDAQNQISEAEEYKRRYEEQLKAARADGEKIIDEAVQKAAREYDRLIAEAKHEAQAIRTLARDDIQREHAQMLKEVSSQVAGLAIAVASKVIEANMDTASNKVLVDKFIDEAGVA